LGDWNPEKCVVLEPQPYPVWEAEINTAECGALEFKYILVDVSGGPPLLIKWESDGKNRQADPKAENASLLVLHHIFGDMTRNTVEVHEAVSPASQCHSATFSPPVPATESPAATTGSPGGMTTSVSTAATSSEALLGQLQVDPSVRFGRFSTEPGAFEKKYELRPNAVLGTGMSGGVCIALARDTNAQVAVKTLPTDGLQKEQLVQVQAEVENQLMMDHPNICRLLEVFEEPGKLRLVMERMRGPDLLDHLNRKGRYTEQDAACIVRQMTAAVAYCHRNGVCHRDLKLENFCLEDETPDARVKMIDFGLSSAFQSNVPMTNACGTLYYVAPEVISQNYDKKCDLWSLGVIAYVLLDGRPPFHGRDDRETYLRIRQGKYHFSPDKWSQISSKAKDFISSLLRVNVSERMDAEEAMAHPWLSQANSDASAEPIDAAVLEGLKHFSKSNALKRAVLRAVTPVATIERVAKWADHFEALDTDGDGKVLIADLARALTEDGGLAEADAEQLSAAFAESGADADGSQVSYSAFLAACLSAHVNLDDQHLRELFNRLDRNQSGTVSCDDLLQALGDVLGSEALQQEFAGKELTYNEFRWLMSMPRLGPSIIGLRQLLGACKDIKGSWKLSTRMAKAGAADDAMEAARRENMAWRVMQKQKLEGSVEAVEPENPPTSKLSPAALTVFSLETMILCRGLKTREELKALTPKEQREVVIEHLVSNKCGLAEDLHEKRDEELVKLLNPSAGDVETATTGDEPFMRRTPTMVLVNMQEGDDERKANWAVNTLAAKEGCVEAARQENMRWRKMHIESRKASSRSGSRSHGSKPSSEAGGE